MQRLTVERMRAALPPAGAARVLTLNAFTGSIGTGLFLTGSMLFFTRSIGLAPYQVALGLSIAGLAGMAASVPVGALADRIGPRRSMVVLHLWRVVTYTLYITVHSFPAFLAVVCATTMAEKAGPPVNQAMVGMIFTKQERVRTMAFLRAVRNVGLSLGALLAGLAVAADSRLAYDVLALGNAASFLVMAALVWSLRTWEHDAVAAGQDAKNAEADDAVKADGRPLREWPFLALSTFNGVLALHDTVLFVGLPLWIAEYTPAPRALVSGVLIVNTALTAVSQVRWTRMTDTTAKAVSGMVTSGVILAVASVAISFAHFGSALSACLLLVVGVVLLTAGENLHASARWEVSFNLSPAESRSRYLAVFTLGESARDLVGPTVVTTAVVGLGVWGWFGLAGLFVLSGLACRLAAGLVQRRRALQQEAATASAASSAAPATAV